MIAILLINFNRHLQPFLNIFKVPLWGTICFTGQFTKLPETTMSPDHYFYVLVWSNLLARTGIKFSNLRLEIP